MKEHPILFSGSMVQAILQGHKTQTRRIVTNKTALEWLQPDMFTPGFVADPDNHLCQYGYAGDRLWVRETWHYTGGNKVEPSPAYVSYRADGEFTVDETAKWRPSIFMPRWASRITLEIVNVRVERLQAITEKDAEAEGIHLQGLPETERYNHPRKHIVAFQSLWNLINAERGYGWDVNPWVWVIEFKVV